MGKRLTIADRWARALARDLMRSIKPKPLAVVIAKPPTSNPSHGWQHQYGVKLDITLSNGETLSAFVQANTAADETSGSVQLDAKYGGVVALRRLSGTAEQTLTNVTESLVEQVADHLSRSR